MKTTTPKTSVKLKLTLQNVIGDKTIPSKKELTQWLTLALQNRRSLAEITVRIVDTEEMTELNHTYRGKAYPTNVLSFPFEAPPGLNLPILGDLVLCADVVRQEALAQAKTTTAHWAHLIIHGCLHLLGYDHKTDEEAHVMESIEIELLAVLGFANPYGDIPPL